MSQILLTKPNDCIGCMDCVDACKTYNDGSNVINIFKSDTGYSAIVCQNCVNPRCEDICFKDAISRSNDCVNLDADTCVGCKLCMLVCPIGAIDFNENEMLKCSRQCIENEGDSPACVSACKRDCLEVVDAKDFVSGSREPFNIGGNISAFKFTDALDGFCTLCGACQRECPTSAISLDEGKPIIDKNLCIICDACVNTCPVLVGSKTSQQAEFVDVNLDAISPFDLIKVTDGTCVDCKACSSVCPTDALEVVDRTPIVNEDLCVLCDACVASCPIVKGIQKNKVKS